MKLLLICVGGAAGTAARYLIAEWAARRLGADFPYGTFAVNVTGSFLVGAIEQLALTMLAFSDTARLALTVGVMGGFTTYSAFSYQTVALFERGAWAAALIYVAVTTVCCLAACALGIIVVKSVFATAASSPLP